MEEIITKSNNDIITNIREVISDDTKKSKEVEITIELEEQNEFIQKIKKKNNIEKKIKRKPGRSKNNEKTEKNQTSLENYINKIN